MHSLLGVWAHPTNVKPWAETKPCCSLPSGCVDLWALLQPVRSKNSEHLKPCGSDLMEKGAQLKAVLVEFSTCNLHALAATDMESDQGFLNMTTTADKELPSGCTWL